MSQDKFDPENVSTVSVLTRLKANPAAPAGVSVSDLKYTILDSEHVYRGAQELAELHSCDATRLVNSYVAFKPARLALHEAIVGVVTTLQVQDEEEMQATVAKVHRAVLDELAGLNIDGLRNEIETRVAVLVDARLSEQQIELLPDPDEQQIWDACETACNTVEKASSEGYGFGSYAPGYSARDAMIALATDSLYSNRATQLIKALVLQKITADATLQPLQIPPQNERKTLLVTGGISSGKGSSVKTMEVSAEHVGIAWKNIAKINGDSLKPLLLQQSEVRPDLYSQLSQEEASLLTKIKIKGALREMVLAGTAPHMFFDQTRIERDAEFGVENGGQVIGLIVSTDVENAISRAAKRGEETGRFEAKINILGNHKAVADELTTVLTALRGKRAQFTLVDNNVSRGQNPIQVMIVDTASQSITVLSPPHLADFAKKSNINSQAMHHRELYTGTKTYETYLEELSTQIGYTAVVPALLGVEHEEHEEHEEKKEDRQGSTFAPGS